MSQDRAQDLSPSDLPEPVGDWISEVAAERGLDEEQLLSRLLAATDGVAVTDDRLDEIEARLDELSSEVDALQERDLETIAERLDRLAEETDDLDAELDEKIEDVRERVIQVKREADAKAPADHDHPDVEERLDDLASEVETLEDDLRDLETSFEESAAGSEAFREEVREEVDEVTGDIDHKLDVLASAVVDLRRRVSDLDEERSRREVLRRLRRTANRNGIGSATCESCEESVDLSLLSEPTCPHCEEPFRELDPKSGFFGSNVLRTGTPPALEGETASEDVEDAFEDR